MTNWLDFPDPVKCTSLLPVADRRPYYIVAPAYRRSSVGVRCLHLLVHWLNRLGQAAWLLVFSEEKTLRINPEFVTPELTVEAYNYHRAQRQTPIVVYPEIIAGNPLRAQAVVRLVLNFPGLLGGDAAFAPEELVFGFSATLAAAAGAPENILHIPALDTRVFSPEPEVPRSGNCYYVDKYTRVHGGSPFRLPPGSIQIPSDANAMDQSTIAGIFRRSEFFYVYENTGLVVEAGFCGCPVVMMPNPWLSHSIAEQEFGHDGIAWGDSDEELARAKATVGRTRSRYQQIIKDFFPMLERFVEMSQAHGRAVPTTNPLFFEGLPLPNALFPRLEGKRLRWRVTNRLRTLTGRLG